MVAKQDQEHVKALLVEAITVLCKNGLRFDSHLSIEALIGITLDKDEVFLVNIKETFNTHNDRGSRVLELSFEDVYRDDPKGKDGNNNKEGNQNSQKEESNVNGVSTVEGNERNKREHSGEKKTPPAKPKPKIGPAFFKRAMKRKLSNSSNDHGVTDKPPPEKRAVPDDQAFSSATESCSPDTKAKVNSRDDSLKDKTAEPELTVRDVFEDSQAPSLQRVDCQPHGGYEKSQTSPSRSKESTHRGHHRHRSGSQSAARTSHEHHSATSSPASRTKRSGSSPHARHRKHSHHYEDPPMLEPMMPQSVVLKRTHSRSSSRRASSDLSSCSPDSRKSPSSLDDALRSPSHSAAHLRSTDAKLRAVQYAEARGNRSAARAFDVPEGVIRRWREDKDELIAEKTALI